MTRDKVHKLLHILGAQNIINQTEWIKFSCLFAKFRHKGKDAHPSAGLYVGKGVENGYNCLGCNIKFNNLDNMLGELSMLNMEHDLDNNHIIQALLYVENSDIFTGVSDFSFEDDENVYKPFPKSWLDSFSKVSDFQNAKDYLAKRNFPESMWSEFDLRYDLTKMAIGFPYCSGTGSVAGMRSRIIDPMVTDKSKLHYDYKYKNHSNAKFTWYRESKLAMDKPLIVVEGEFDVARVYQQYRNVTGLLTATASAHKMKFLEKFPTVLWMTDNDKAGNDSRKKAEDYFNNTKTDTVFKNIFIPEEFKDPNDIPAKILKFVLSEHVLVDDLILT